MKYLSGQYYIGVKGHRYKIHPTENNILGLRVEPKSLRTQYQVENETQIRKNQKVIKIENNELVVKKYPRNKQPTKQQPKLKPTNCPKCKQNIWLDFDKGWYCRNNCESIINKHKHQIDKKVRGQDKYFSTRLPYAKRD